MYKTFSARWEMDGITVIIMNDFTAAYGEWTREQVFREHASHTGETLQDWADPREGLPSGAYRAARSRLDARALERYLSEHPLPAHDEMPDAVSAIEWGLVPDSNNLAMPTQAFWEAWHADKDAVKSRGYEVRKNRRGDWCILCPPSEEPAQSADAGPTEAEDGFPPPWDAKTDRAPDGHIEFRVCQVRNGKSAIWWADGPIDIVDQLGIPQSKRDSVIAQLEKFKVGNWCLLNRGATRYRIERI